MTAGTGTRLACSYRHPSRLADFVDERLRMTEPNDVTGECDE